MRSAATAPPGCGRPGPGRGDPSAARSAGGGEADVDPAAEAAPAPAAPAGDPVPWETWVVIGLVALDVVLVVLAAGRLPKSFLLGAATADFLMIVGLVLRSRVGLVFCVALLSLRTGWGLWLLTGAWKGPGWLLQFLAGVALLWASCAVLLIRCVKRGAYATRADRVREDARRKLAARPRR